MITKENNILTSSLNQIKKEIEKELNIKIINIRQINKKNCSTRNAFFVYAISNKGVKVKYFLKFNRDKNIEDEIKGTKLIKNLIKTPKIISFSKNTSNSSKNNTWILFEFIKGSLMSDIFIKAIENPLLMKDFFIQERLKELDVKRIYLQSKKNISFEKYLKSRTNKLFYGRLFGQRYRDFYLKDKNKISSKFDRKIFINGNKMPYTINQIVNDIKKKYMDNKIKGVKAVISHGDAHHGNIILGKNVYFIDNEYADYVPPFMDLAKAYYNDYLGILFFHYHKLLNDIFKIKKYKDNGKEIHISIRPSKKIDYLIKIAKIKLSIRKDFINKNTKDFLSLNDYLILCHMLTKNPNFFPKRSQKLFLIFIVLLSFFNPLKPDSMYRYFNIKR